MQKKIIRVICCIGVVLVALNSFSQGYRDPWIRPSSHNDKSIWGLKEGIVVSLWPYALEGSADGFGGGPRGLLRIGMASKGRVYHLNFIAVEPVVNGKIEFSEISPSTVDNQWGKLMWASDDSSRRTGFFPTAISKGVISYPDPSRREIEELSFYVHMEQFKHGAFPYLRIFFRSDRPMELGIQVLNRRGSAKMERCVLTATMGNYSRLRKLYLKDNIIDATQLYKGYDDIHFIEKPAYPANTMLRTKSGDFIAVAATNETFESLANWPQTESYQNRINWRYRMPFAVMQYWRKPADQADPSLQVRVNGRAKYWSGGSLDKSHYIDIPGGPSFENFELQENYVPNQVYYYGLHKGTIDELIQSF